VKQREGGVDRTPRTREDQSGLKHGTSCVAQEDSAATPAEGDHEAKLEEDYQWLQNREEWHDE
jgi:hypothetical protein